MVRFFWKSKVKQRRSVSLSPSTTIGQNLTGWRSTSLFADDTMAFQDNCSGEHTSPCCDLGKHLENLSCWAASNNVDFNAAKSADLVVGSKPPPSACLFMNSTALPRVQRHVHLGITIKPDLRWNDHVATVLKKVAPALHLSLTLAYRHQLPPAVIRKF